LARRAPTLDLEAVLAGLAMGRAVQDGAGEADPATTTVLDVAATLLAERGLRGWSMDDVAERAGVGRATVYRRFDSRDQLVQEAVVRDARRFFRAVTAAVSGQVLLVDKVVDGLLTALRLVRTSPLESLVRADAAAALSLLTSETVLRTATEALAEQYESLRGPAGTESERYRLAATAEALIRLGWSFVLNPGITGDDDPEAARAYLDAVIRPLLAGRS
jgi:AcrR family transcriptional regulator